ncbi:hypothetical protein FBF27_03785 [Candidatus Saccharibacteria bacterium oral taxon 488]|nr:hypothetical protein FBF27_03785 [Candidatus Saccharibacteria bacterium oral taxon 488]
MGEKGEKNIGGILSKTQADVLRIEEETKKQVGALMEQYEKNKKRRMAMGNEALRSEVTNDLIPRHKHFESAVKEMGTDIGKLLGQLVALGYDEIKTPEEIEKKRDRLCADLSFLRFVRGVARFANDKRSKLMKKLIQGVGEDDLAWYINPKNSRSTYCSVLTIDESLREKEKASFRSWYGDGPVVPMLYLGKKFAEYDEKERYAKAEEIIVHKLAEFTKQGLIPPVSIELYIGDRACYNDLKGPWGRWLSDPNVPFVAVEAECF